MSHPVPEYDPDSDWVSRESVTSRGRVSIAIWVTSNVTWGRGVHTPKVNLVQLSGEPKKVTCQIKVQMSSAWIKQQM